MPKISIPGDLVTYGAFWRTVDKTFGRTFGKHSILNELIVDKRFFKAYSFRAVPYYSKEIRTSLHRFFSPCFPVSIMTIPILPTYLNSNMEYQEGRDIVNVPYAPLYSKIL